MKKTCNVIGCNGEHKAHGLCNKHYKQLQRGTLTEPVSESFVVRQEDYATVMVPYEDRYEGNILVCFEIDLEDAKEIEKYDWGYDKANGVCYHDSKTGRFALHRFLMNVKDRQTRVYFKDNNHFNCRKDNLIVVLPTERTEYENDRDAFIAKKEQQNNKSYGSTPVIEIEAKPVEERNYSNITKISNGYLITLEINNEPYTEFFHTKEEAIEAYDNKVLDIYSDAALDSYYSLVESLMKSDPLNLFK